MEREQYNPRYQEQRRNDSGSISNLDIRKDNIKKARKQAKARKACLRLAAVATSVLIASKGVAIFRQWNSFQQAPIHATMASEVEEQIEDVYGVSLQDIEKNGGKVLSDAVVDYCIANNQYIVNDSDENRVNYVASTKDLIYAMEKSAAIKIQNVTGEKNVSLHYHDPSGGDTNAYPYAKSEYHTYDLQGSDFKDLYNDIHQIKDADGNENMTDFSYRANSILKEAIQLSQKNIVLTEDGALKSAPMQKENLTLGK